MTESTYHFHALCIFVAATCLSPALATPPVPSDVTDKEYSNNHDWNAAENAPVDGQIIEWDGAGGAANSQHVMGRTGGSGQIDALANVRDVGFHAAISDQGCLVLSRFGGASMDHSENSLYYSDGGGLITPKRALPFAIRSVTGSRRSIGPPYTDVLRGPTPMRSASTTPPRNGTPWPGRWSRSNIRRNVS